MSTPWMEIAWAQVGVTETPGTAATSETVQYFRDVGRPDITSDEIAWCAAFVGACLLRAGIKVTLPKGEELLARSFLKFGVPVSDLPFGSVGILKRDDAGPTAGHVIFITGSTPTHIMGLGGNQKNTVSVASFPRSDLLGVRWPVPFANTPGADPKPTEDASSSSVGGAKAPERPRLEAAKRSNTIFGTLLSLLGGLALWIADKAQLALEAAAEVAKLEPVRAMLLAAGANWKSMGFGFVVFGVLLAISRRLIDAGGQK